MEDFKSFERNDFAFQKKFLGSRNESFRAYDWKCLGFLNKIILSLGKNSFGLANEIPLVFGMELFWASERNYLRLSKRILLDLELKSFGLPNGCFWALEKNSFKHLNENLLGFQWNVLYF